jgi:DNA-binding response OmpR family regulator
MKQILVIEDDLFIRENVCEALELSGYDVITASNGKEGLDLAFEQIPDLIVCDIMMPLADGFEVKESLSLNSATKNIPFIFLSAKTEIKELNTGTDDYITKPFEIKDLLTSVKRRFDKPEEIILEKKRNR